MKFQEWLDYVNGKFIDVDGKYGAQCVDLVRHYLLNCLGIPAYTIPSVNYAKQIFDTNPKGFKKINNIWGDLTNKPIPGDIVVWGWLWPITGIAGHVGICTWSDGKDLIVMNQNYGSTKFTQLRKFGFNGVRGWLRFIK